MAEIIQYSLFGEPKVVKTVYPPGEIPSWVRERRLEVKNVKGESTSVELVTAGERYAWHSKDETLNCGDCSSCIRGEEASNIITHVNALASRKKINPGDEFFGICCWGTKPKLLYIRPKPHRCEYFGKTKEEYRQTHPGLP